MIADAQRVFLTCLGRDCKEGSGLINNPSHVPKKRRCGLKVLRRGGEGRRKPGEVQGGPLLRF